MKTAEKILMLHLNKNRIASKGNECTDADYFKRWKMVYPDTFNDIIAAMEDYKNNIIPDFKRNATNKY